MNKFKSSFSRGMILSTIIVVCLLGWFLFKTIHYLLNSNEFTSSAFSAALAIVIVMAVLMYAYASRIIRIELTEDSFIIKKRIGRIVIPRNQIRSVHKKKGMYPDTRIIGIGGVFGYIGLFFNEMTGSYKAYVNNTKSMIQLETTEGNYVVSCDDRDAVIEQLLTSL